MNLQTYKQIENHMLSSMIDSAHDAEHIYRVLYNAIDIATSEQSVDYDILLPACLLHDIGRCKQFEDSNICHATAGGDMAYQYLLSIGFSPEKAEQVRHCIAAHRYRNDNSPESVEAKILFDADKLDVTGAMGIARSLLYQGHVGIPLYSTNENGGVVEGLLDDTGSFFHEYHYKLKNIYNGFYTKRGTEIAQSRKQAMTNYYDSLLHEVTENRQEGKTKLNYILETPDTSF